MSVMLEQILSDETIYTALNKVRANKGAPGVDNMDTDEVLDYLKEHLTQIKGDYTQFLYGLN